MAIKTYTEQLEEVQAAITAVMGGQSYAMPSGRSMTRADLGTLQEREKWLRQMVTREQRGGIRIRGATPV